MFTMVVTLDVSKLSGWLNAAASCRVKREPCGKRGGMRGRRDGRGVGRRRRRKQRAQGGPPTAEGVLAGAGAERTLNISAMVVTLDVSKLSGWLNAAACCRVKRGPCGEEGRHAGPGHGRGAWDGGASSVRREEPSCGGRCWAGARAERT